MLFIVDLPVLVAVWCICTRLIFKISMKMLMAERGNSSKKVLWHRLLVFLSHGLSFTQDCITIPLWHPKWTPATYTLAAAVVVVIAIIYSRNRIPHIISNFLLFYFRCFLNNNMYLLLFLFSIRTLIRIVICVIDYIFNDTFPYS